MPQVRANPKTWLYVTDAVVVPRSRVAEEALLPEVGGPGRCVSICACREKGKAGNHGSLWN